MPTTTQHTYCRICEPHCGLIATLEDGRMVSIQGDPDHVQSQGFFCTKAAASVDVVYDPDRVTRPMKRIGGPAFPLTFTDERRFGANVPMVRSPA